MTFCRCKTHGVALLLRSVAVGATFGATLFLLEIFA
nr:MAG TPA: hypothetical protein [Caudoviricetes sp.]